MSEYLNNINELLDKQRRFKEKIKREEEEKKNNSFIDKETSEQTIEERLTAMEKIINKLVWFDLPHLNNMTLVCDNNNKTIADIYDRERDRIDSQIKQQNSKILELCGKVMRVLQQNEEIKELRENIIIYDRVLEEMSDEFEQMKEILNNLSYYEPGQEGYLEAKDSFTKNIESINELFKDSSDSDERKLYTMTMMHPGSGITFNTKKFMENCNEFCENLL